ncbi:hypothetical protein ACFX5E_03090 [Flavobacterium sp. LS2P90]|uniref:Uncharacterized protein n=1 Tax=Flavobacterium xylosi TaxID=3230415 RepID=A0ABW6HST0_9FLAO
MKLESNGIRRNIRDEASIEQLVVLVLSNLESIIVMLIQQGISQPQRLQKLNALAINQMKSLFSSNSLNKLK